MKSILLSLFSFLFILTIEVSGQEPLSITLKEDFSSQGKGMTIKNDKVLVWKSLKEKPDKKKYNGSFVFYEVTLYDLKLNTIWTTKIIGSKVTFYAANPGDLAIQRASVSFIGLGDDYMLIETSNSDLPDNPVTKNLVKWSDGSVVRSEVFNKKKKEEGTYVYTYNEFEFLHFEEENKLKVKNWLTGELKEVNIACSEILNPIGAKITDDNLNLYCFCGKGQSRKILSSRFPITGTFTEGSTKEYKGQIEGFSSASPVAVYPAEYDAVFRTVSRNDSRSFSFGSIILTGSGQIEFEPLLEENEMPQSDEKGASVRWSWVSTSSFTPKGVFRSGEVNVKTSLKLPKGGRYTTLVMMSLTDKKIIWQKKILENLKVESVVNDSENAYAIHRSEGNGLKMSTYSLENGELKSTAEFNLDKTFTEGYGYSSFSVKNGKVIASFRNNKILKIGVGTID